MITNKHNIGLSVAVMLCTDDYDYDPRPNSISSTGLLKPMRALALSAMHSKEITNSIDVTDLVNSAMGTSVHDRLENTWLDPEKVKLGLAKLGFTDAKVLVNPTSKQIKDNPTASKVYVENRSEIPILDYILTGKYDIVLEGKLEDLKNTGSFKVIKSLKEVKAYEELYGNITVENELNIIEAIRDKCPSMFDYAMQGSIYGLLNPEIITEDFMSIQFIMKDWMKYKVGQDFYPEINPYQLDIRLFSSLATKAWVTNTLLELQDIIKTGQLPMCNDNDLWRDPPLFKVYKDKKSKRALPKGTFDSMVLASAFNSKRKEAGDVRLIPSTPKRCNYCSVRSVCSQYEDFVRSNLIKPM